MVLTGGGSRMEGVIELAEEVFHMPVRAGVPQYISGLADVVRNPIYSTGVGLLLFSHKMMPSGSHNARMDSGVKTVWERMKNWFHGNF